ncbi:MAG: hypothetical protein Q4B78_04280 [Bacillota bacterium]|nr:hypothetical protein [Bacillota bacterium]
MLGTLMKYEFKGMWQRLGVFYLAWLAVGIIMGVSLRGSDVGTVAGFAILAFVIATVVAVIMTLVAIVDDRFNKNMLGDEGYFTMSLPVSIDSLLMSKTLSAVIWIAVAYIASAIAGCIFAIIAAGEMDMDWGVQEHIQVSMADKATLALIIIEALAVVVLFTARFVLKLYASISVGRQFNKHQGLISVVVYIVYCILESFVVNGLVNLLINNANTWNFGINPEPIGDSGQYALNVTNDPLLFMQIIAVGLLIAAVYYIITRYLTKNRLNLQ